MVSSRRLLGFLFSIVLIAFSLPALGDSGDKFSVVMGPSSAPTPTGQITFTATIKNLARFDYLKSYTITVPAGLTINVYTPSSGSASVSGQVVSVSGTLVQYNKTTQLTIKATPGSTLGCGPNTPSWGASAKGGLIVNNEVFTLDSSSVLQTSFTPLCYTLNYGKGTCDSISGTSPQTVAPGVSGTAVTAVPLVHYHFVNWSDGSTANPRTDKNANVNVTASCAIDTYTLTYTAGAHGSLTGTSPQTVNYGTPGSAVTAVADPFYSFANWSDTSTANPRTDPGTGNVNVTANFVPDTLTITSKPSSAAINTPFDVVVKIDPGPATVTPDTTACGGASWSPQPPSTSATFTFTIPPTPITIPPTPPITACAITFSAPNYLPMPLTLNLQVLAGATTACADPSNPIIPAGAQFTASCGAANGINVTGFAAGVRGPNKDPGCNQINFTLTNNICNTVAQADANGNLIPPNAVSFVWDPSAQRAAFTYTVTWQAEYVDPGTGLPVQGRTQYCVGPSDSDPSICGTKKTLKACTSSAVAFTSIPMGEPACSSEEDWATVSPAECQGLANPNPGGSLPPPACIRATTTIIDAKDPPIIRG